MILGKKKKINGSVAACNFPQLYRLESDMSLGVMDLVADFGCLSVMSNRSFLHVFHFHILATAITIFGYSYSHLGLASTQLRLVIIIWHEISKEQNDLNNWGLGLLSDVFCFFYFLPTCSFLCSERHNSLPTDFCLLWKMN